MAALATAVGALPVFLVQRVGKRQESGLMAFSAGVMLAAAIFALLLPSLDAGRALLVNSASAQVGSAGLTAIGLLMCMGLMMDIDKGMPHEHAVLPPAASGHTAQWAAAGGSGEVQRAWLMVLALLIHNLPEGLAVGAAYSGAAVGVAGDGSETAAGASVALAIGLQNMPEGLIVAMALRSLGKGAAFSWGLRRFPA